MDDENPYRWRGCEHGEFRLRIFAGTTFEGPGHFPLKALPGPPPFPEGFEDMVREATRRVFAPMGLPRHFFEEDPS